MCGRDSKNGDTLRRQGHELQALSAKVSVPLLQIALTPFQRRVYRALLKIPRGKVTTYRLLAAHLGCGSYRAVGQALRRNPLAPLVPCHRVISSDLSPGGFQGRTDGRAATRKLMLLKAEGVRFVGGRLEDPSRVFDFGAGCVKAASRAATPVNTSS